MVKEKCSNLVFVMETKLKTGKFESIKRKVSLENCLVVDSIKRGGGLALFWKMELKVELMNYSRSHINVGITDEEIKGKWLLTCFYGQPNANKRKEVWDMLLSFKTENAVGWCVLGDFN